MPKNKGKGSSLFKHQHIGTALLPPAAFTAVPNIQLPFTFLAKMAGKSLTSPVVPSILGATAIVHGVALGSKDRKKPKPKKSLHEYELVPNVKSKETVDEDEVVAKLAYEEGEVPSNPALTTHASEESFLIIEGKRYSDASLEHKNSLSEAQSGMLRRSNETISITKSENLSLSKSDKHIPSKESSQEVVASTTPQKEAEKSLPTDVHLQEADKNPPPDAHLEEHDGGTIDDPSNVRSKTNVLDLDKRLSLKEEQTKERIMKMINDVASSVKLENQRLSQDSRKDSSKTIHEKELIEDIANTLKGQIIADAEGVVLKQKVQDAVDETQVLKNTVERLNSELSRYQEKCGVSPDLDGSKGFISNAERAKWLTNVKFLSPLFLSYDRQLQLKDDVIADHEEQFMDLTRQMEIILKENEVLRKTSEWKRAQPFISQQKWDNLKEQNELMLEEIQLQLQQLEVMEEKTKKMHVSHVEEVSRLAKRLALTDAESKATETARMKLKEELSLLRDEHDRLLVESAAKVPPDEHARAVSRLKHELEDVQEQNLKEMKQAMFKLKEMQQEKCNAVMIITELTSDNKELQGEVEALEENRNELLKKLDCLQSDLDEAEERELECQLHLANTVRVAEQATNERATYAAVAEKERIASEMARRRTMRERWEMGRMEEALKRCKVELASHNKETSDRIRDVEDCHTGQLMQYERKMSHLKKLLEQKQQALDDLANNKKQMEFELETVWQAASSENRMMMDTLSRSDIFHR